jgi:pimeloyl-CoA synthetase
MVSALGQGLKASGSSEELRQTLQQLLAEHDKGFVDLLQKELERVKEQMTAAFAVKRTVSAYAQTAQFRGE